MTAGELKPTLSESAISEIYDRPMVKFGFNPVSKMWSVDVFRVRTARPSFTGHQTTTHGLERELRREFFTKDAALSHARNIVTLAALAELEKRSWI